MGDPSYNPVIGYMLLDENYRVISPDGKAVDPVFHSRERAVEAAEEYGRQAAVFKVEELYLEGTFNVVLYDVGDLMLDGHAAERFVKACRHRGMVPNKRAVKKTDPSVTQTKYSCRELFGDIAYNRSIALNQ